MNTDEHRLEKMLRACLKIINRVAMVITLQLLSQLDLGRVFSHSNAWFMRAAETVSPSPGGEGRGEGGLQTLIKLHFKIFKQALVFLSVFIRVHPWLKTCDN
jgi:hypothetical protein